MFGEEKVAEGSGSFDAEATRPTGELNRAIVLNRNVNNQIRFYLAVSTRTRRTLSAHAFYTNDCAG